MIKLIKKYGSIATLIVVGIPVVQNLITGTSKESFAIGEIIGYTTMIIAMATVFVAMKHFRDNMNEGIMSFGQGLQIGLGISMVGGLAFAIYNAVFVTLIMPDFNEQYFSYQTGLEVGSAEFETQFKTMMETSGWMFSVVGGSILMFVTVFLIGFVESVISALIFQKKPQLTT